MRRSKKTHYIYFLLNGKEIVYIGCSKTPETRIRVHSSNKKFTAQRVMGPYSQNFAFDQESRWIRKFTPKYNLGWLGNSGRKPITNPEEKVIQLNFYVKSKYIELVGGMERAREIAKSAIENMA